MPRHIGSRLLFVIAVALAAAALGDALVETVSNSGVVGRGYSDNNHLSVIPTFLAGAFLALLLIARRCVELARHARAHRNWLLDMAAEISARSPLPDLPFVLLAQFASLFAMESIEQLIFGGQVVAGTEWLGGPVWFAVIVHVLLGCACTIAVALCVRSIVARCACLIGIALEFLLDVFNRQDAELFAHRRNEAQRRNIPAVHVHQIGERAPPLLATLT